MSILHTTKNTFSTDGFWSVPLPDHFVPRLQHLELFDQNGYDLTPLELMYAEVNSTNTEQHRSHRVAIKHPWFVQDYKDDGAILNHSLLFERKGYTGAALKQLKLWTKFFSRASQLIAIRPKWGLDFSMDYVDCYGNCFEILHWEYDGFEYNEIEYVKSQIEPVLKSIDWDDAGQQLLKRKNEWHHLDFFAQSDWKCNYFGIVRERFKMVCWE